ncbi:MAG: hypothetical protein E3J37_07240 [Anaerolineales bacterium]|nr:MAG: hypothetical protein E3J37_07240 [Anaerolineales bacterium]
MGVMINGAGAEAIIIIYDAANTGAGLGGVSVRNLSRHSSAAMVLEKKVSKIGVFMEVYDPELASLLMGEFL